MAITGLESETSVNEQIVDSTDNPEMSPRRAVFRRRYWVLIPALAIIAYLTVLRIGFLSDDLVLLYQANVEGISLLPVSYALFYRPVGLILTWVLGWQLWGYNPLPYHLQGLLIHAATSLVLGLWVAEATTRRSLGWLAGTFFAVFPLHMEALGWLAAQWDALAAFFAVASLYFFTIWWRRGKYWYLYLLSALLFGLGLFTKESLLTWLPMYGLAAWFVTVQFTNRARRRLLYSMIPFLSVLALNVTLRVLTWGNLGGYRNIRSNFDSFLWDGLTEHIRLLLSPISPSVMGTNTAQIVGVISSAVLLWGLVYFGYEWRRWLFLTGTWIILTLLPVLNLPPDPSNLQQNRLLYLPSAGYCICIATLAYSAILRFRKGKTIIIGFVAAAVLASIVACWIQLRPWHTATLQANYIGQEFVRMIPPQARSKKTVWYVENMPDNYKGAYLFRIGMNNLRYFLTGENPRLKYVVGDTKVSFDKDQLDTFSLHYNYNTNEDLWQIDKVAGVTDDSTPPDLSDKPTSNSMLWDFRRCAPDATGSWNVVNARVACNPGEGLGFTNVGKDSYIEVPNIDASSLTNKARFVRIRVAARYAPGSQANSLINRWSWKDSKAKWNAEQSESMPVRQDGKTYVYWTFVPTSEISQDTSMLRFDLDGDRVGPTIEWIAVDPVD